MPLTGNKGEWSEIYTLFKLLGEKIVYAGDGELNKIEELFYPILKILRNEKNNVFEYGIKDEIIIISENGIEITRKPVDAFLKQAKKILSIIRQSNGAFSIPEIEQFMNEINCRQLKAKSIDKTDIRIVIHDLRTGMTPELGFSIKSQVGNNSTLLNAGKTTNFRYKITDKQLTINEINEINKIKTHKKIIDRVQTILKLGADFRFSGMDDPIFYNNLVVIDSWLPQILAELLLQCYKTGDNNLQSLTETITKQNPLNYDTSNNNPFYEYKIKQLLVASALGMRPHYPWNGKFEANGGYLVVKDSGDVLCYHFYDRNLFEDYLFYNTKFESASTTRHGFAELYNEDQDTYFKLNLQIRFK